MNLGLVCFSLLNNPIRKRINVKAVVLIGICQLSSCVPNNQGLVFVTVTYSLTSSDCVLMLVPESSTHIGQAGGEHVVCGRRRPHHHHGSARLTDPGQYTTRHADISFALC